jgi:uncharacterized protein YydD (DUF2326 family)
MTTRPASAETVEQMREHLRTLKALRKELDDQIHETYTLWERQKAEYDKICGLISEARDWLRMAAPVKSEG